MKGLVPLEEGTQCSLSPLFLSSLPGEDTRREQRALTKTLPYFYPVLGLPASITVMLFKPFRMVWHSGWYGIQDGKVWQSESKTCGLPKVNSTHLVIKNSRKIQSSAMERSTAGLRTDQNPCR